MAEPTRELLQRFKNGDSSAYRVLWERYRHPLTRYIRRRGGSLSTSASLDDVVQETQARALAGLAQFRYRREMSFFFWLCGIARNILLAEHRRLGREMVAVQPVREHDQSTTADLIAQLQAPETPDEEEERLHNNLETLMIALDGLTERRRESIVLRYLEGYDNEAAARITGMTLGSFRVTLARALADLRSNIDHLLGESSPSAP
jgi:RNA polymerase sigma factor (sigma-70 family)